MTHLDDGADLRAVMERSVRDLDVPDRCGPAALASGRRIRTRRRVTFTLTGVAAVAAVTALTLPALGGGSGGASPQFADDPTPSPVPSEGSGLPSEVPVDGIPTEAVEGWWSVPGTRMAELLEQQLPDGVTVETVDTTYEGVPAGTVAESVGSVHGTLSASTGPGAFQLLLYPPELDVVPDPVTTTDAAGNEHTTVTGQGPSMQHRTKCRAYMDSCLQIRDSSGTPIGRVSSDVQSGTTLYEAFLQGPDGGGLNFTVMDSSGDKPGYEAPSAEAPPLTLEQLRTLVEDPVWTSYRP